MSREPDAPHPPLPPEALGLAPGRGRLAGRRILVVGAGTRACDETDPPIGNGRAIALLAAREGAAVACADRDPDAARETLSRIQKAGGRGEGIEADVARPEACEGLPLAAHERLGGLDGLVVNVGIGLGRGFEGTTLREWDQTFAVNLRAHFLLARAALPVLPRGSSIVFISSVAGRSAGSGIPAYDASKAGLEGLCRNLARVGGRQGLRANVVVPGLIDTPLGRLATRGRPGRARTPVPLGRQGTGWEVAYAAIFLLSAESSYVTGETLVVDGGLTGA